MVIKYEIQPENYFSEAMKIKIFATSWGLEHLSYEEQFRKIKNAGYDGIETGRIKPEEINQVKDLLEKHQLLLICQQWTEGETAEDHIESFKKQAKINFQLNPLLVNSHTGKDHFGTTGNLKILNAAVQFESSGSIPVTHETHRGRFSFASHVTSEILDVLPELKLTADFSHWCCVAESYLEDQQEHLEKAIKNCYHIHARIGNTQTTQVNDHQSSEWEKEKEIFLKWWKRIITRKNNINGILPITCEFGPAPYMPTVPFIAAPLTSQWKANLYMKDLLKKHFK